MIKHIRGSTVGRHLDPGEKENVLFPRCILYVCYEFCLNKSLYAIVMNSPVSKSEKVTWRTLFPWKERTWDSCAQNSKPKQILWTLLMKHPGYWAGSRASPGQVTAAGKGVPWPWSPKSRWHMEQAKGTEVRVRRSSVFPNILTCCLLSGRPVTLAPTSWLLGSGEKLWHAYCSIWFGSLKAMKLHDRCPRACVLVTFLLVGTKYPTAAA